MFSDYLANFLDYLEVEKGRSLKTIENYSLYLNRFYEFAGDIKVGKIDLALVSKWRQWLNRYSGDDGRTVSKTTQNYPILPCTPGQTSRHAGRSSLPAPSLLFHFSSVAGGYYQLYRDSNQGRRPSPPYPPLPRFG